MLQLKPYVSYWTPDVVQSEFTSRDLCDAVYSEKIVKNFRDGKLSEMGEPLEHLKKLIIKQEKLEQKSSRKY